MSAFPYYLHVTPAEDRFLGMPPGPGAWCLFHVSPAEDRFLVMPPAGDFPAEESHQSPPGLRPRTPLSRAAVGFRPAANLHPTAASVRPCARCGCLPRLISSQSPKASAIAWCPLIAATDCCARFRTPLPWQLFFRALRRNKTSYHGNAARDTAWQLVRHCRRMPRRGGGSPGLAKKSAEAGASNGLKALPKRGGPRVC